MTLHLDPAILWFACGWGCAWFVAFVLDALARREGRRDE